jgi:hypothetical protein
LLTRPADHALIWMISCRSGCGRSRGLSRGR